MGVWGRKLGPQFPPPRSTLYAQINPRILLKSPKEKMTVLVITHLMVPPYALHNRLWVLATQAIVE